MGKHPAESLGTALGRIAERCRGGEDAWELWAPGEAPWDREGAAGVVTVLDAAWREGASLADSIDAWRSALEICLDAARQAQLLLRLFLWRGLVACGLAGVARYALLPRLPVRSDAEPAWLSLATIALAVLLLGCGYAVLKVHLPMPWMLARDRLSGDGVAWLAAHIGTGAGPPFTDEGAQAMLQRLREREQDTGVPMAAERRRQLRALRLASDLRDRKRLARLEELMPLAELLFIGGAAALVLLPGLGAM